MLVPSFKYQVINQIIDQNQTNKNLKSKQHKIKQRTACLDEHYSKFILGLD